eukprot:COSAG05_NODE_2683_length_2773_cov_1.332087_1_plen_253_part_00
METLAAVFGPVFNVAALLFRARGLAFAVGMGHEAGVKTVTAFAVGPGQWRFVTGSYDRTAKIWSLEGEFGPVCVLTLEGHVGPVYSAVAFEETPGKRRVLTGSVDGTAKLWDMVGNVLVTLKGHEGGVHSVAAFRTPTKQWCLMTGCSLDQTAKLWTLEGHNFLTLTGHTDHVLAVGTLAGQRLLTASADNTCKVWSLDGRCLLTLNEHSADVTSVVAFTAGRQWRVLTGSQDGTGSVGAATTCRVLGGVAA